MKDKPYVYRFEEEESGITKYIGISATTFPRRIDQHFNEDKFKGKRWKIYYFFVNSRTDAEAYEGAMIYKYKTYNYFNTAKSQWGPSDYLPDPEWKEYDTVHMTGVTISEQMYDLDYRIQKLEDDIDWLRGRRGQIEEDARKEWHRLIYKCFDSKYSTEYNSGHLDIDQFYVEYIESIKEEGDFRYLAMSREEFKAELEAMYRIAPYVDGNYIRCVKKETADMLDLDKEVRASKALEELYSSKEEQ